MDNILVKETMYEMVLKQLGAEVVSIHGLQCFIKFMIDGIEVSYAYNINKKDKYYLQRIKPYHMSAGVFDNVTDVVDSIKTDVEQFKNAVKSGNFEDFLKLNSNIIEAARNFENLFLNYNVDKKYIEEFMNDINTFKMKVSKCVEESERVFFTKAPEKK